MWLALDALGKSVTGAKNAIAAAILPAFVPMVKAITDFVQSNRELLSQVALPAFLGLLATSVISLGVAIAGMLGPWALLVGAIVAGGVAIYQNWDKVKAFFDEIDLTVDQRDIGNHLRIAFRVCLQHGSKVMQTEHDGCDNS